MSANGGALRAIRWIAWGLVGALTGIGLYLATQSEPPKAAIGGPFTLTAMTGNKVNIAVAEKNKPYAVFFGFTHCPDICPTSMYELSQVLKKVDEKARDFRIYFVSVDPERDTPELLSTYLSLFDSRIIGMTGTPEEIAAVAKLHRAFYRRVATPSGYTMDHTATIYLFDRKGAFFGTLDTNDPEEARIAKLERLFRS